MKPFCFIPLAFLAFVPACAHYPINAPLKKFDPHAGYRFENTPASPTNSDDLFIVVTFSGGGARAAAFDFGVLEQLRKTSIRWHDQPRTLLDEVDVLSASSGGSFTAAYYALYRDKTFTDFPEKFLYTDFQSQVVLSILNPINWPRLISPQFDRIDIAAEVYDQHLYDHKTFADLPRTRPYVVMTASDISLGTRFEFTQEQFDFLYSDLNSVPIARAVAASAAFPVALSPITFDNYAKPEGFTEPAWVSEAPHQINASPRIIRRAADLQSYEDAANRPHVRLLDGAVADYMGLRAPYEALISPDPDFSIRRLINRDKIKKLVIISANTVRTTPMNWDTQTHSPGFYDMYLFTASAPIRNYSFDTVNVIQDLMHADELEAEREMIELVRIYDPTLADRLPSPGGYESYFITLDFSNLRDAALRQRIEKIRSTLSVTREQSDDLRKAAAELLRDSPEFQRLLDDLK